MASPDATDFSELALLRWRLVLGRDPGGEGGLMAGANGEIARDDGLGAVDRALDFVYGGDRGADLADSMPYVPTWLGDIRRYFPRETVAFLEQDAIERRGLKHLLFEPETLATLEKDIRLVATIMAFKDLMPEETRRTARAVVAEIVTDLRQRLEQSFRQAVLGALRRDRHAPAKIARNFDIRRTVKEGLRNYDSALGKPIPDRIYFFANQRRYHEWRVIVLVDQSGSMGESVVYASIVASVFASLPALDTRLIFFDTSIADVSDRVDDPVDLLFGAQLGGGTDIARAVGYAAGLVERPEKTIILLISDLYESGNRRALLRSLRELRENRVNVLSILALNDAGVASFDRDLARDVRALDIPTFAATPGRLAEAVDLALRGEKGGSDGIGAV